MKLALVLLVTLALAVAVTYSAPVENALAEDTDAESKMNDVADRKFRIFSMD